jgi:hypothetical protein
MMAIALITTLGLTIPPSILFQADEVNRERHTLPMISVP